MFFSSRGHFDRPPGTTVSTDERLSSEGWQNCASCHFEGLTDGVVCVFGAGPRKSVPLNATFNPRDPDEQQDPQLLGDLRRGRGLRAQHPQRLRPGPACRRPRRRHARPEPRPDRSTTAAHQLRRPRSPPFRALNADRQPQPVTVTLPTVQRRCRRSTALREWVRLAIRTPNGPLDSTEIDGGVNPANDRPRPRAVRAGRLPELPRRQPLDHEPQGLRLAAGRRPRSSPRPTPNAPAVRQPDRRAVPRPLPRGRRLVQRRRRRAKATRSATTSAPRSSPTPRRVNGVLDPAGRARHRPQRRRRRRRLQHAVAARHPRRAALPAQRRLRDAALRARERRAPHRRQRRPTC